MRTFSLGFFLGTLCLLWLPVLPMLPEWFYLTYMGLVMALIAWGIYRQVSSQWLWLVGMMAGCGYALWVAQGIKASGLPADWEGQDKVMTGMIVAIPEQRPEGTGFLLDVDQDGFQGRLRLTWYNDQEVSIPTLRAGERWQLRVRSKRPNGFANPNGFDYEQWLFAQRILGSGYVRSSPDNQRLAAAPWWNPDYLRQQIREHIVQALAGSAASGLVQGLAVAHTADMTSDQWQVLRDTGTVHLLAISGLHITMVAAAGLLPVWLLWRWFPVLYLWVPVRIAGAVVGAVLASGYAVLAGFNIPTQRTLLMLLVLLAGLVWRRQIPFSVTLSVALLLVLLLDPLAALSAGFWLSFLTVCLLVLLGSRRRKPFKGTSVSIQLLLSLGTVPLTAGFFGMVSLSAPLANLVAIPLVTLVATPLVLLGIMLSGVLPSLAALLWQTAAWLLEGLMTVLQWLAGLPFSSVYLPLIPWPWLVLGLLGFVVLCLPRGMPARWLGGVLMLPLAVYQPGRPEPGAFQATLLDVGQGLSSVVMTATHVLVFDTGPKTSDTFDTGELVLVPWLHGQGVHQVDRLIVSHSDTDHSGGTAALLSALPVSEVLTSAAEVIPPGQHTMPCVQGQGWEWDGVRFTVIHPGDDFEDSNENNRSCVLRVENDRHSLLLAADIERVGEQSLLRTADALSAEVLLVPHHGSQSSSSPAFIQAVAPTLAIVTSGYHNRFHHPHPEVLARYARQGTQVLNTVDTGALQVDFPASPAPLTWQGWRQVNPHFWYR